MLVANLRGPLVFQYRGQYQWQAVSRGQRRDDSERKWHAVTRVTRAALDLGYHLPKGDTPHEGTPLERSITEEMVKCECGGLPQTVEHVLLECPQLYTARAKHLMVQVDPGLLHGCSHTGTRCAQLDSSDFLKRYGHAQLPGLCGSPDECITPPPDTSRSAWQARGLTQLGLSTRKFPYTPSLVYFLPPMRAAPYHTRHSRNAERRPLH